MLPTRCGVQVLQPKACRRPRRRRVPAINRKPWLRAAQADRWAELTREHAARWLSVDEMVTPDATHLGVRWTHARPVESWVTIDQTADFDAQAERTFLEQRIEGLEDRAQRCAIV